MELCSVARVIRGHLDPVPPAAAVAVCMGRVLTLCMGFWRLGGPHLLQGLLGMEESPDLLQGHSGQLNRSSKSLSSSNSIQVRSLPFLLSALTLIPPCTILFHHIPSKGRNGRTDDVGINYILLSRHMLSSLLNACQRQPVFCSTSLFCDAVWLGAYDTFCPGIS